MFFWVGKISNIFLGCLKFLILFGGESLRTEKKIEYPPYSKLQTNKEEKVQRTATEGILVDKKNSVTLFETTRRQIVRQLVDTL